MRKQAAGFLAWLGLLLLWTPAGFTYAANPTAAELGQPIFFKETGHTLAYNFRYFWETHGGLPVLGYPISEVVIEEGRPVQYFERTRLEWHADKALVLAGLLGSWSSQRHRVEGHPAFKPVAGSSQRGEYYFSQTGHNLRLGFQQYWRDNGGLPVFGYPLSEEFDEVSPQDGRRYTVQYFERARFEYHPQLPEGHRVLLGHLGRQYVEQIATVPPAGLARVSGPSQAWEGLRPTRIRLPRVGVNTEIVEGGFSFTEWEVPRYTAVHYWPVAAFPGSRGNIVLAGHSGYRNTIFDPLQGAAVGDEVFINSGSVERKYRVTGIRAVPPGDLSVLNPTLDETLTLITCTPPNVYNMRLILTAKPA